MLQQLLPDTDPDKDTDTGADRTGAESATDTVKVRPGLVVAVLVLATVLLWAAFPGAFTHWPPDSGVPTDRLKPPSPEHWFGTDSLGRDLYSRVVHGSATSLAATAVAVAVGLVAGSALGLLAGSVRGWVDDAVMRLMDVLLAIPGLLLSLALSRCSASALSNIAVAVGVASVANSPASCGPEALRGWGQRSTSRRRGPPGCGGTLILLPPRPANAAGPALARSALEFGMACPPPFPPRVLLGLGPPPPASERGSLLPADGTTSWPRGGCVTLPGVVIAAVVLSTNRISQAFQINTRTTR